VCITTSYIQDDIMIVFTMAFKCVLKILKTCVSFTGLQEEYYFCSRKIFTCRKLTGVETLLLLSITFQLNEKANTWIVNSEHSDCISHSKSHTHTHTHTNSNTHFICIYIYIYIYININIYEYMYSEINTLYLDEISVSAMWICR